MVPKQEKNVTDKIFLYIYETKQEGHVRATIRLGKSKIWKQNLIKLIVIIIVTRLFAFLLFGLLHFLWRDL